MKQEQFDHLLEDRFEKIRTVLSNKSADYVRGGDKLHNFKVAAGLHKDGTPEKALWGMLVKHLVSIKDLIDDSSDPFVMAPSLGVIDEKVGDAINYLILLEALWKEPWFKALEARNITTKAIVDQTLKDSANAKPATKTRATNRRK